MMVQTLPAYIQAEEVPADIKLAYTSENLAKIFSNLTQGDLPLK